MKTLKFVILLFFILIATINTKSQCNGIQSFTISPQPTNGEYVAGTVVSVCYSMNGWTQFNSNWIDGFLITLGSGWTNLTPGTSPINCNGGGGQWIWLSNSIVFGSNTIGPGWYFDLQSDGNPTNDYGDNGTTCIWSFCFTVKVTQNCTPQSLLIQVTAGADGTWGSWTQTGCPTEPIILFNGTSQSTTIVPPTVINQTTYCVGDNASPLTATGLPGNTLLWYTTPTGGVGQSSITPSTITEGITTYYVSQVFTCGESPRVPTTVIVYPKPIIQNYTDTICSGTAFNLTPSNAPPTTIIPSGTLYTWTVTPNPNISGYSDETIGQSFISQTLINNTTTPQIVTYNITPNGPNCIGNTFSLEVFVNPTPVATQPNNITICNSLYTTQFVLNNPPSVGEINWTNDNTSIGLSQSGNNTIPSFLTINSTQSSVTSNITIIPSYNNCIGLPVSFNITVTPRFLLGDDLEIDSCYNSAVNLNLLYNTTNLITNWTLNNNPVINAEHIITSGNYQLIATNSANCSDTVIVRINILPKVVANAGQDTIAVLGQPHQLIGSGGISFLWTPTSPIISLSTISNPVVILYQDQSFYLETKDIGGCKGFDTVFVKVYEGPEYYIPNSFTPNNDGLNDIFRPIPVGIISTDYFRIYNRYGQLLFQTNSWLKGWDGTYKGNPQQNGTYIWMIKGSDNRGKPIQKKGTVILIR